MYKIVKIRNKNLYRIINSKTKQIHSTGSTKANALKQIRLLEMIDSKKQLHGEGLGLSEAEMSDSLEQLLQAYGTEPITAITAIREPVESRTLLNIVSLGSLEKNIKKLGYDELFHLSLNIELENGQTFNIEKHETVIVGPPKSVSDADAMTATVREPVELHTVITNMENIYGANMYRYDALNANCQMFVEGFLGASNAYSTKLEAFVKQNAEAILKNQSTTFYRFITDIARKWKHGIMK